MKDTTGASVKVSRRVFIGAASLGAAVAGAAVTSDENGDVCAAVTVGKANLTIADPEHFRILQVTDLHFFSGGPFQKRRNARTVDILRGLVDAAKPDLVMVTGDLWPENRDGKGETFMRYAIEQLEA